MAIFVLYWYYLILLILTLSGSLKNLNIKMFN